MDLDKVFSDLSDLIKLFFTTSQFAGRQMIFSDF